MDVCFDKVLTLILDAIELSLLNEGSGVLRFSSVVDVDLFMTKIKRN